ncbi:DUF1361 domain-containing protein [Clostridium formicaceticum]|uniref:DUF1361 domain-containing protein n=1 Tax=Clostridium formicaceticum TaxID=1497 RepID=A0AAC9WFY3_9CLOT|nr:DUF1361 domain-containing protein [Clostridium formicaceticum]AOY76826.1 hypothetical protein BJL90_13770 [Clostridium formicaceticum]ARE87298.1 hypothetical protein CLFO_16970 [Clostridium formicaceticum]
MNRRISNVTKILAGLSIALVVWMILGGSFNTYYLVWNLILAWAPMIFALIFRKNFKKQSYRSKNMIMLFSSFLWLFFFPNAVYLTTDYIHLSNDMFYYPNPNYKPYSGETRMLYNFDLLPWNNFFSITFGVLLGCALSVLSLYIFHKYIESKKGKGVGWMFVIAVHFLSGYAIYLGRFIRFNSWDVIFSPLTLIKFLLYNIDSVAVRFTLYFFVLSLFVYSIFYLFIYLAEADEKASENQSC